MNYDRIYQELMAAARRRGTDKSKLDGYYERHHIVPRCLGGSNDEANLVLLTAREHFVAHRLLAKAHPGNSKLLFAVASFKWGRSAKLTSYQVALAREAHAAAARQLVTEGKHNFQTAEARRAQSLRQKQLATEGKLYSQTAEAREALRQRQVQLAAEGQHNAQTAEFREALSLRNALLAADGSHPAQTAEARRAQSRRAAQLATEGKLYSQTAEAREALRQRNTTKVCCPHCSKTGGATIMRRYHFDNCRHKEAKVDG